MKKLLALSLLLIGVCFGTVNASAAAYVGDTDNITINPEENKKAIEILKETGELESIKFPLEKLTTEIPVQSISDFSKLRISYKTYRISESKRFYNIMQIRCNELAPVGFDWYDNGIPLSVVNSLGNNLFNFYNKEMSIADSGVGVYDQGYYWRKFNTASGSFWASVWNFGNLVYG